MPIVSFSYMTLKIGFYMVEITPLVFGNVSFLVNNNFIKNNELTNLQSFFDRDTILKGKDVLTKGGRGKTILFKKDGFDLILRHYKRGGLFGKLVKDSFFTFESYCNRSFDEFKLLNWAAKINVNAPNLGAGNWWVPSVAEMGQIMHDITYGTDFWKTNPDIVNRVLYKLTNSNKDTSKWHMISATKSKWTSSLYGSNSAFIYDANRGAFNWNTVYWRYEAMAITIYKF